MRDADNDLAVQAATASPPASARGVERRERFIANAHDGTSLVGYRAGDATAPTCLIVNAFGMEIAAVEPLVAQLCRKFHVVTWDCRVLPGDGTEQTDVQFAAHIHDARSVLQSAGVDRVALLAGWCTGARVALHFAAQSVLPVESLLLINGAFRYVGAPLTPFTTSLLPVLQWVSRKPHMAASIAQSWIHRAQPQARAQLSSYLHASDARLAEVTSRPFKDGDSLLRYARLCLGPVGPDDLVAARALRVPTVVLTGAGDTVAAPDASVAMAAAIPNAQCVRLDDADHYIPYLHSLRAAALATSLRPDALDSQDSQDSQDGQEADVRSYKVVRSDHGDMALAPATKKNPPGWHDAAYEGTREQCLDHIERTWTMSRAGVASSDP